MIRGPVFSSRYFPEGMASIHASTGHSWGGKVYCRSTQEAEIYVARFRVPRERSDEFINVMRGSMSVGTIADFRSYFPLLWRPSPNAPKLMWCEGEIENGITYAVYRRDTGHVHVLWIRPWPRRKDYDRVWAN
jgi:hypothetical protein